MVLPAANAVSPSRAPQGRSGRRTSEGQSQAEIAHELRPMVESVLDELDRWLSLS
jgi:hypothetical protein